MNNIKNTEALHPSKLGQEICASIFYQSNADTDKYTRNMPHWCQKGKMHFVTFRLADFIPQDELKKLYEDRLQWQKANHPPLSDEQTRQYCNLFYDKVESWLDGHLGSCILADRAYAELVVQSLMFFNCVRYELDHWVIMPNHIHLLLMPLASYDIKGILHSIKSYTANQINKLSGKQGRLWQQESFDHIVRSQYQLDIYRKYIIQNHNTCPNKSILNTRACSSGFLPGQDAREILSGHSQSCSARYLL